MNKSSFKKHFILLSFLLLSNSLLKSQNIKIEEPFAPSYFIPLNKAMAKSQSVRSVKVSEETNTGNQLIYEFNYDRSGNQTKNMSYIINQKSITLNTYSSKGLLIQEKRINLKSTGDSSITITDYVYDSISRIFKENIHFGSNVKAQINYVYDSTGNYVYCYKTDPSIKLFEYLYKNGDLIYANGVSVDSGTYDSNKRLIYRYKKYPGSGKATDSLFYLPNGLLEKNISYLYTRNNSISEIITKSYLYDAKKNMIELKFNTQRFLPSKKTLENKQEYMYNKKNLMIKEIIYTTVNEIYKTYILEYEYY